VLKERIGLKTAPHLPKLMKACEEDWNAIGKLGMLLVESWEFEGDPKSKAAWDEIDLIKEIPMFAYCIGKYLNDRQEAAGIPKG
jgi:hypothetical protein